MKYKQHENDTQQENVLGFLTTLGFLRKEVTSKDRTLIEHELASLASNFLDLLTTTCDGLEEHLKTSTRTLLMLMEDHQRMEETMTLDQSKLNKSFGIDKDLVFLE